MPEEEFVGTGRHGGNVHGFPAEHKSPLTGLFSWPPAV
jgi:hypothetical protein